MNRDLFETSLIHTGAGQTALHLFTAYLFGLWTIKMMVGPIHDLAHLPVEMVQPVGIIQLLPSGWLGNLMTETALWGLRVSTGVFCALSMIPRLMIVAGPFACLGYTLHQSIIRSFGIVNHPEIAMMISGYVLVLFAGYRWWGVGSSAPSDRFNPYSVPLVTIALLLTVAYAMVGVNRFFFEAGPYIFASDTLPNFILQRSLAPNLFGFEIGKHVADWPAVVVIGAKFGFFASTLIEMTAPLCLISRYYRYLFFAVMVPFHIVILLTMNISFFENVLLYIVLIDFSGWLQS